MITESIIRKQLNNEKIISAIVFFLAGSQMIFSQATDSANKTSQPVTITGSVDAYYRNNFNNPKSYPYNSLTSFTHSSNSFELGMASIRADHSFGKVSATSDLGFGTRAEEFAYNGASTRFAVKQANVSYARLPQNLNLR
jgi:hypothetical protein